jgi:hypothetical protein
MGISTSEVGYNPAMPRREDHEVHKGHVVALGGGTYHLLLSLPGVVTLPHFNTLKAELNPICHLLSLLGAYHILHVSRIRVKDLHFYCRHALLLSAEARNSTMPYHVQILLCSLLIAPYNNFLLVFKEFAERCF